VIALAHGVGAAVSLGELAWPGAPPLPIEHALAQLHPDERDHARTLTPVRARDFAAGRLALHLALADAGLVHDAAILSDDRGAPALFGDALGSISHKRGLAVAIAARAAGGERIGVDIEVAAPSKVDLAPRILTDAERASLPSGDRLAVTLRFALKEAVYKAIDPFLRRYVGFREVAVWPEHSHVRVDAPGLGVDVEAAWVEIGGLFVCSARATAR